MLLYPMCISIHLYLHICIFTYIIFSSRILFVCLFVCCGCCCLCCFFPPSVQAILPGRCSMDTVTVKKLQCLGLDSVLCCAAELLWGGLCWLSLGIVAASLHALVLLGASCT